MLGLGCCTSFSLVVVSGGCALVEVCMFLSSGFSHCRAQALGMQASVVVAPGL